MTELEQLVEAAKPGDLMSKAFLRTTPSFFTNGINQERQLFITRPSVNIEVSLGN